MKYMTNKLIEKVGGSFTPESQKLFEKDIRDWEKDINEILLIEELEPSSIRKKTDEELKSEVKLWEEFKQKVPGPWNNEPDEYSFVDDETGYKCFIFRMFLLGHLCGYVEVPEHHKLYGADHNIEVLQDIEVHGGITFGDKHYFIKDNVFVFGFDCGHPGDLMPCYHLFDVITKIPRDLRFAPLIADSSYKDIEYVKAECKKLAKQLKALE